MTISFPLCELRPPDIIPDARRGFALCGLFAMLGYGIVLTLFSTCMYLLKDKQGQITSQRKMLRYYITWTVFLDTVLVALTAYISMDSLIERSCPPGSIPSNPFFGYTDIIYILTNWTSDFLLIWRCKVIFYDSGISPWLYMGIPGSLLSGSICIGIPLTVLSCIRRTPTVDKLLEVYCVISLCINLIVTAMIVTRLYLHHRRMRGSRISTYTNIIAILIESALLVIVMGLVFVVLLGTHSWYGNPMFVLWIQSQPIASLLIVFRVAQGKTWSGSGEANAGLRDITNPQHSIMLVSKETAVHVHSDSKPEPKGYLDSQV